MKCTADHVAMDTDFCPDCGRKRQKSETDKLVEYFDSRIDGAESRMSDESRPETNRAAAKAQHKQWSGWRVILVDALQDQETLHEQKNATKEAAQ